MQVHVHVYNYVPRLYVHVQCTYDHVPLTTCNSALLSLCPSLDSAYLSCDGSVDSRQLFFTISKPNSAPSSSGPAHQSTLHYVPNCNSESVDTASISIVVQPVPDSALAQVGAKAYRTTSASGGARAAAFDYTRQDTIEAEIELRKSEPLPFSSKRSMFSTGKVAQVH